MDKAFHYEGRDLEAMSFAPRYHEWILDHFTPFTGQNLCEVGAGTGTFSEILLNRFQRPVTMIEPSSDMVDQLKERLKAHPLYAKSSVINGFSSSAIFENEVDTFFYVNVLEHIEDDQAELNWMFQQLKSGGHVCLFSPAIPALFGSHDERVGHFRRYTKKELVQKTKCAGFRIEKAIYFDLLGVPLWWLNFVVLKGRMNPSAVGFYDKVAVPFLRKFEPANLLLVGKNVLVVGKKE